MEFKETKQKVLEWAEKGQAFSEEYKKALKSENNAELLNVIKANIGWCLKKKLNGDMLVEWFGNYELEKNNIFANSKTDLEVFKQESVVLLGYSEVVIEIFDSSNTKILCYDSSTANIKTYDSSTANIKTYDSSTANIKTYDSSIAYNRTQNTIYTSKENQVKLKQI